MYRSLLIKAGMLIATISLVLWMGWPIPQERPVVNESSAEENTPPQTSPLHPAPPAAIPAIPSKPVVASPIVRAPLKSVQSMKLDINHASAEELQQLPGIGPVLARRVIELRTIQGSFKTIEDLKGVKGIGQKRMEQLRPLIMVGIAEQPSHLKLKTKSL